jgi:threonine dehydrogenase-like Zn-dependent dehydrogenase
MRAAIFRKGEIVVGEVAEAKPGPGQVLVKTLACGICGTDLHARVHADKMIEMSKYLPWRKPMDLSRDVVFGHEFAAKCWTSVLAAPAASRRARGSFRSRG